MWSARARLACGLVGLVFSLQTVVSFSPSILVNCSIFTYFFCYRNLSNNNGGVKPEKRNVPTSLSLFLSLHVPIRLLDVMIVTASNYQHAGSSTINHLPSTASSLASSRANSPSLVRRDSILKRAGSVKGDQQQKKNVSIVTDLPSVEVVSERRKITGTVDMRIFMQRISNQILLQGDQPRLS